MYYIYAPSLSIPVQKGAPIFRLLSSSSPPPPYSSSYESRPKSALGSRTIARILSKDLTRPLSFGSYSPFFSILPFASCWPSKSWYYVEVLYTRMGGKTYREAYIGNFCGVKLRGESELRDRTSSNSSRSGGVEESQKGWGSSLAWGASRSTSRSKGGSREESSSGESVVRGQRGAWPYLEAPSFRGPPGHPGRQDALKITSPDTVHDDYRNLSRQPLSRARVRPGLSL